MRQMTCTIAKSRTGVMCFHFSRRIMSIVGTT